MMRFLATALILALTSMSVSAEPNLIIDPADNNPNAMTHPMKEESLLDDKIYFFAHSMCQTCRPAFEYIYSNHKDLEIPITDMKFHHNFELYKQCVSKFNIKNSELKLPLICMGNQYIIGWNEQSPAQFENALKEFQNR